MRLFLAVIILNLALTSCATPENDFLNYNIPLQTLIDSLKVDQSDLLIRIDKSGYKFSVLADSTIIKEYPVVFGGNPTDDKMIQGDQCTPEGTFYIVSKYRHKFWTKFIWINYPTADSWRKHNSAKENGKIPANSDIGGEIGIHGVPDGADWMIDIKYNWTLGCISLKNKDVDEIYPYITSTTKILIRK